MTRLEALERVAEAAREIADQLLLAEMTIEDRCDADVEGAYDAMIERMRPLIFALDALPPEEAGETVEAAVWEEYGNGALVLIRAGGAEDRQEAGWIRIGTTCLVLAKEGTP